MLCLGLPPPLDFICLPLRTREQHYQPRHSLEMLPELIPSRTKRATVAILLPRYCPISLLKTCPFSNPWALCNLTLLYAYFLCPFGGSTLGLRSAVRNVLGQLWSCHTNHNSPKCERIYTKMRSSKIPCCGKRAMEDREHSEWKFRTGERGEKRSLRKSEGRGCDHNSIVAQRRIATLKVVANTAHRII